jgi:hypothetical protein
MPKTYESTRVVKKLAPTQPGATKLALRFGDALVCVRYRHDPDGRHRYTTVELVIERALIARRPTPIVAVRIGFDEHTLQRQARLQGAKWNSRACLWYMPRTTARALDLLDRIVHD